MSEVTISNYRLDGPRNALATQSGLANALWWRPPISRKKLESFSKRGNARGLRDTTLWLVLTALSVIGFMLHGYHGGLFYSFSAMEDFMEEPQILAGMNAVMELHSNQRCSMLHFIIWLLSCYGESQLCGDGPIIDITRTRLLLDVTLRLRSLDLHRFGCFH